MYVYVTTPSKRGISNEIPVSGLTERTYPLRESGSVRARNGPPAVGDGDPAVGVSGLLRRFVAVAEDGVGDGIDRGELTHETSTKAMAAHA